MTKILFGLIMISALLNIDNKGSINTVYVVVFCVSAMCLTLVSIFDKEE